MNLDTHIQTTRRQAAERLIDAAFHHLLKAELECVITLAAAAEAGLPTTENAHVFAYLKKHPTFLKKEVDYNETINWLKHPTEHDEKFVFEYEAAFIIFRAMSKYIAVYQDAPARWEAFLVWGQAKGYFPEEDGTNKNPGVRAET